jgi:flavin-dependent dehydrogenase
MPEVYFRLRAGTGGGAPPDADVRRENVKDPHMYDFDFAVAGGGPAGSSAAISLAQKGHRVLLIERERFPRFHIGESLLSTANDHFAALGVTAEVERACFPPKWGARLYTHDGMGGRGVDFTMTDEVTRPQTWQVCREELDRILLERARALGVDVREEHRVSAVEFGPDAATLSVSPASGEAFRVRVRALVDASGRHGLLAKKFDLRTEEPRLANIAVYSHFSNVPLCDGDRPTDIRLIARNDAGWFWMIPISKELVSVGVVVPKALYMTWPHGSPEEMLERAIADTPIAAGIMKGAKREWPVRVEKDFSYFASRYAGDRWILAGDAGSFLDPVFSTGVSIALESGIEAAAELDGALRADDFRADRFARFSRRQRRRYETFRRFVVGFYTPQFRDLFFSPEPPKHIFRAVVTVLAGNWKPRFTTRALIELFFFFVAMQRRFDFSPRLARRTAGTGFLSGPEAGAERAA